MSQPEEVQPLQGIAIVGMAGRFPGARTLEHFWENLRDGVESVSFFSDEELLAAGVDPAQLADPAYVRAKAVLDDVAGFDAAFFGFTPREAELMDPQHRVLLECAWEALEDAGYDPERYGARAAVYVGSGTSTYLLSNLLPNQGLLAASGSLQALLLNDRDFLATRLSYKLNLRGPSVLVQTACSTSLVAVHMACQGLLAGEADLAIAGGVSIGLPLVEGYLYHEGGISSPDGHCRAFDAAAGGSVAGNGAGVVVLKRLDAAMADGDQVYAVIRGSAVNNDGSAKVGFTAPSIEGQAEVITESLLMAGVEPETIGFVEGHGSGTALGDPIEVLALRQAYGDACASALGSVKTNVGHLNTAAGVAGLIKAALAVKHGTIPPSLHFERPNPRGELGGFRVPTRAEPWPEGLTPRRAGVSSFGLGGTNVHAVLEEAPEPEPAEPSPRPWQLLTLSARTPAALEAVGERLAERLELGDELSLYDLADIAFTLQVGRKAFAHRRTVVARDRAGAVAALREGRGATGSVEGGRPPVVFLFPGLGDHYVDMARGLYETEPRFAAEIDRSAGLLRPHLGMDIREALFKPGETGDSGSTPQTDLRALLRRGGGVPEDAAGRRLARTEVAQPAVFVVEHALARLLMEWGVEPEAMIGYSIGEYVAACLSGVLSLEDALKLVAGRAKLIQELPGGAMLAVPLPETEFRPLLDDSLAVAATNGPHFCVVAGPEDAVAELERRLAGRGAAALRLGTTHAFHSPMLDAAAGALTDLARSVRVGKPRIPYLSNVTGTWITAADLADPRYWARHMVGTVRFAEGLAELLREPGRLFLEVGPGSTLASLVRQHPDSADQPALTTLRRGSEMGSDSALLQEALGRLWVAGVPLDAEGFFAGERRRRVALPTYPFQRQRYWIDPPTRGSEPQPAVAAALTPSADLADWFWVPSWKSVPLVPAALVEEGRWLVFLDGCGLGERLAERLRRQGRAVATVTAGQGFSAEADAYTVDPGRRQDYDELVKHLRGEGGLPSRIVHLWGVTAEEPSFAAAQKAGLFSLLFLEQAIAAAPGDGQVSITLVANGLHEVADGDPVHPGKATVLGAIKVIHQESPRLTCGSVDVVLPSPGSDAEARLIDQVLSESTEPVVALRGRQRWVRSFEMVRLPETADSRLAPEGVYLVTDGAHGAGAAVAEYLRGLGAKVALASPSEFPAAAIERLGPVRGVFHTLPAFTGGLLQLKTAEALHAALDPVAASAEGWLAALAGEPSAFLVLVSSTLAVTGGLGQLDIAAAGAYLDALAQRQATADGPFTVVAHWDPYQWDGWLIAAAAGGMAGLAPEEVQKILESHAVPRAKSGEALRRLLAAPLPRVFVTSRPLPTLIAEADAITADTLMAQMAPLHRAEAAPRPALSTPYVPPQGEREEALASLWQELFGIAPIGADDSFLELGGHSLLAIQVVTQVRNRFAVDLPVTALFESPTVAQLAKAVGTALGEESADDLEDLLALVEGLSAEEAAERLAEIAEIAGNAGPPQPPPVARVSGPSAAGDWPLTFDQERLWILHRDNPGMVSWNVDAASRMRGDIDIPALTAAFREIERRHAAWRTTFPVSGGQPVQRVAESGSLEPSVIDLTALPAALREAAGLRALYACTREPFDLERGPLVRVALARLAEREYLSLVTVHHLVTDWITFQVVFAELMVLYEAFRAGRPCPLPEPPVQFPDYAVWERRWWQGEALRESTEFWRRELGGFPLVLDLPAARPRPAVQSQRGGMIPMSTGPEPADRLRALARREGVTTFMALLAVLDALLARVTGREKIVVGSNSANRPRPELASVVGFFLTQVPFAVDLSGDPTFRELLARVKKTALAAYGHQNMPFAKLVEALAPEPDASRNPVVQVLLLVLEGESHASTGSLESEAVPLFDGNSRWDLMFGLYDYQDLGFSGPVEYNADIFSEATVRGLIGLFQRILEAVTADPDARLSQLPSLAEFSLVEVA